MKAVQSGKGGFSQGSGNIVDVNTMFGGISPETVTQDQDTGVNDLKSATVATMGIPFEMNGFHAQTVEDFEKNLEELAQ